MSSLSTLARNIGYEDGIGFGQTRNLLANVQDEIANLDLRKGKFVVISCKVNPDGSFSNYEYREDAKYGRVFLSKVTGGRLVVNEAQTDAEEFIFTALYCAENGTMSRTKHNGEQLFKAIALRQHGMRTRVGNAAPPVKMIEGTIVSEEMRLEPKSETGYDSPMEALAAASARLLEEGKESVEQKGDATGTTTPKPKRNVRKKLEAHDYALTRKAEGKTHAEMKKAYIVKGHPALILSSDADIIVAEQGYDAEDMKISYQTAE